MSKPAVAVIGAGKVGSALAVLLQKKGYPMAGVASRTFGAAQRLAAILGCPAYEKAYELTRQAGLVFITTPDREIAGVAAAISRQGGFGPGQIVAHASGAHAASELRGAKETGARVVSIHPLQSFADVEGAMNNLPGSYFALQGDEEAISLARQVVSDLEGKAFIIEADDKALYHAAACIASNYLVSLMHLASGLYGQFGLSREEAFAALYPLVQGTLNNIKRVGPTQALTGPVSRGDATTVKDHLPALARAGGTELNLYRDLGLYTIQVALDKGSIDHKQALQLRKVFEQTAQTYLTSSRQWAKIRLRKLKGEEHLAASGERKCSGER